MKISKIVFSITDQNNWRPRFSPSLPRPPPRQPRSVCACAHVHLCIWLERITLWKVIIEHKGKQLKSFSISDSKCFEKKIISVVNSFMFPIQQADLNYVIRTLHFTVFDFVRLFLNCKRPQLLKKRIFWSLTNK